MSPIKPYAGFWKRFGAAIIDGIIVSVPLVILFIAITVCFFLSAGGPEAFANNSDLALEMRFRQWMALWNLSVLLLPCLYFAWMESSRHQATLGKLILKIKVVNANGERLGFWHAFGRNVGKIISGWILNIGYFMAGATRKKQALHDKMANAYVVEKNFQPGDPLPDVQTHFGILGAVIGAMILTMVLLVALVIGAIVYGAQHAPLPNAPVPAAQTTQNW